MTGFMPEKGKDMRDLYEGFCHLDSITYNHSVRVMLICREYWDYENDKDLSLLVRAALIHDIGKVYVPEVILDKVGKLSDIERLLVDLHPFMGYSILKDFGVNDVICSLVLLHHGFNPPTLKEINPTRNKDIDDMSIMLHTVDVFEALTSDRPYHRGVSSKVAVNMMNSGGTGDFHPDVMLFLRYKSRNDCNSFVHRKKFSGASPGCYVPSEELRCMVLNLNHDELSYYKKLDVVG